MNRIRIICFIAMCAIVSMGVEPHSAKSAAGADQAPQQPKTTIEGLVRDVACPVQNTKATATEFNLQCALDCAHRGAPLAILTRDGDLYLPISGSMPDVDQRDKLMPFVGKFVRVTGTVYERKGTHAIAIADIKELPEVHLKTDAQ